MEAKRQTHIIQSGALYFSEEDLFLEQDRPMSWWWRTCKTVPPHWKGAFVLHLSNQDFTGSQKNRVPGFTALVCLKPCLECHSYEEVWPFCGHSKLRWQLGLPHWNGNCLTRSADKSRRLSCQVSEWELRCTIDRRLMWSLSLSVSLITYALPIVAMKKSYRTSLRIVPALT